MSTEVLPVKTDASAVAIEPAKPRAVTGFDADDPVSLYMDSAIFEQLQRVAKLMSTSELVPAHLRGKQADCFLVAAQSVRWRIDPFAAAQESFVTQGKLGYQGKLIAAIVNARLDPAHTLDYEYSGEGDARKVIVTGRRRGQPKDRTVEGTVGGWKTSNEKWKVMTDQMLSYRGAREWARRHLPEAIIGIQADEEPGETVELERRSDGVFAPPKTLNELTERLAPPPAAKPCQHPAVPPSKVAATPKGHTLACPDCGQEFEGEAEPREPGEDDGPAPAAAGPVVAAADRKGQRRLA